MKRAAHSPNVGLAGVGEATTGDAGEGGGRLGFAAS